MQKNKTPAIAIWSITPKGMTVGQTIQKGLENSSLFVSAGIWREGPPDPNKNRFKFEKLSRKIQQNFNRFQGHVFIFSTGIAVRVIAPLLNSKMLDPAVVVTDDNGIHAISLISGHLGGGNALAVQIADILYGTPVITTATDINQVPAIDMTAKDNGLLIETPRNIKYINMAFLMKKSVGLYDPLEFIQNNLPEAFWTHKIHTDLIKGDILCSHEIKNVSRETLILRPPVLSVGIGCNRGTPCKEIKNFLLSVLKKKELSAGSIFRFATTDIKKDEPGLLLLSKEMKIPIDFYDKNNLNSVKTIQTPSKMAEKHLGVKSVCEAAAILSADNGKLIVPKNKNKDVTIAVAIKK